MSSNKSYDASDVFYGDILVEYDGGFILSIIIPSRKNYNGYLAFVQQYIKHRLNNTTPWASPDGFLLS